MAEYAPSPDFSFASGSYTPSADFLIGGGETYASCDFSQAFALNAAVFASRSEALQWALSAPSFASSQPSVHYTQLAYDHRSVSFDESWSLAVPTFAETTHSSGWGMKAYAFGTASCVAAWRLDAYAFSSVDHDTAWMLEAPQLGQVDASLSWNLVALAFDQTQVDIQYAQEGRGYTKELVLSFLEFNGADGSGVISSTRGPEFTVGAGDCVQRTDDFVFGTAAAYFASGNSYLSTPANWVFDVGAYAPFTVEGWFKFVDNNSRVLLRSTDPGPSSWVLFKYSSSYIYFLIGGTLRATRSFSIPNGTWIHIAATRDADGLCKVWVNGVGSTSGNFTTYTGDLSCPGGITIGRSEAWDMYSPASFKGRMDNLLIANQVIYNQNFTPPDATYVWAYDTASFDFDHQWALEIPVSGSSVFEQLWSLEGYPIWTKVVSSVTYQLTLTGDADDTDDVVLPMSSYSSRLNAAGTSYLQVVVPSARQYAGDVSDRPNGTLVIKRGIRYSDGSREIVEIARAALSAINFDIGAKRSSLSLQGSGTVTNASPKTVTLSGVSYKASSGGRRRYRCSIDNTLKPGDTAIADDDEFVVGELQHIVSTNQGYMELSEQEV